MIVFTEWVSYVYSILESASEIYYVYHQHLNTGECNLQLPLSFLSYCSWLPQIPSQLVDDWSFIQPRHCILNLVKKSLSLNLSELINMVYSTDSMLLLPLQIQLDPTNLNSEKPTVNKYMANSCHIVYLNSNPFSVFCFTIKLFPTCCSFEVVLLLW